MTENAGKEKATIPFVIAAAAWALAGAAICKYFSRNSAGFGENLRWHFGLWALGILDLAALGKTLQCLFAYASGVTENRAAHAFQTFTWGLLKLACLGIFALVIIKGQPIPTAGLLSGTGTLVVVPLVAGMIWSQRVLGVTKNATYV